MPLTRAASAGLAGRPILGQNGVVTTSESTAVSSVVTAVHSAPSNAQQVTTAAHSGPIASHIAHLAHGDVPAQGVSSSMSNSSAPPPVPLSMQEAANSFNTSFWSHGSVASPNYSVLTGLQNRPVVPPADPAVSAGVREIINSAIALSQLQYRQQEEERLRALIPRIAEAAKRSLLGDNDGTNQVFSQAGLAMPAAAPHAPARTSRESVILSSHALASGLTSQQPNLARGYTLPYPERVNPPPIHDPRPLSLGPFNQPPPGFTSSGAPAQPPTSLSVPPVAGVQTHTILPAERLPNIYSRGMRTEPHETHTSPHPSNIISEISGRFNLAKWGVSFDGTDKTMSVQEFIFRVGELKKDYNCPDEVLITKFHQLLEKPALDWYWNHRKLVQFRTWKELESALLAQYQRFENEFQLQMQILNRRQLPHENFEDFYNDVLRLRTQQKSPYREHEIVEIMRGNLKPSLAQMIFSAQINSLGDFYRQVKKAENLVWTQRQQRYNTPQKVHELEWQMEEEPRGDIEVDAVTMTSKYKCWNCGVMGHSWMECREPRKIFCYRCGQEGVTVPDCPKCQGNRHRNPPQSGQARERYKRRRRIRQEIASATLFEGEDNRLYTKLHINGEEIEGLLDSGASVSCLGKNCLSFVERAGLEIKHFHSFIKTADGSPHKIVGRVTTNVKFRKQEHPIIFYLVPSLSRELFLGVDFMKRFQMFAQVDGLSLQEVSLCGEPEISDVNSHSLSEEQRVRLQIVKDKFPCFTKYGLGKTKAEVHSIDTRDATPVKDRHYPVSPAVQKLMYAELDRMIELGVIEESESPWSHPVTLVRRGEKNRLCLDARKLNALTVKDAYPLPHIEGLLSRLGDTYFISSVDLKDAFWQIPLDPSSREKTAFTVPGRPLYQFTVMPFGLCNAAQRLCRLMDKVIPGALRDRVFVYLDDLLVVSPDFDTHMGLLEQVAGCLAKAGLTINVTKSKFCFKELRYLGYIVGGGKLKTDPAKVETIVKFTYPKTAKQVRSFMGTAGWYRRFIADFATIAAPIFETLKKGKRFTFTEEAKVAFDKLKQALCRIVKPVGKCLYEVEDLKGHPIGIFHAKDLKQ
ncbi:uncharacterized protein LOC133332344 [Musca vetustissima]|uniref:uncharacterized protein LOC133332344 n=1 Tax=Musca vetustissima TaxID=27455 RepID=UPI002AB7C6E6|nr:uncharacterized protein LOC133332344 [Musca vetustissima]